MLFDNKLRPNPILNRIQRMPGQTGSRFGIDIERWNTQGPEFIDFALEFRDRDDFATEVASDDLLRCINITAMIWHREHNQLECSTRLEFAPKIRVGRIAMHNVASRFSLLFDTQGVMLDPDDFLIEV